MSLPERFEEFVDRLYRPRARGQGASTDEEHREQFWPCETVHHLPVDSETRILTTIPNSQAREPTRFALAHPFVGPIRKKHSSSSSTCQGTAYQQIIVSHRPTQSQRPGPGR